jgi:hypothetical protein
MTAVPRWPAQQPRIDETAIGAAAHADSRRIFSRSLLPSWHESRIGPERSAGTVRSVVHRIWPADHHHDSGQREQQRDEPTSGLYRRECGRETYAARPLPLRERSCTHAAQENCDVERPVLPSYWMPKALIRDRRASAIVRFDATGWNMPSNRTGRPVSMPNGTMSSISKSITSPTRTLWRSLSSLTSIAARSTPSTSPTNGASAAMGPPSCPVKT